MAVLITKSDGEVEPYNPHKLVQSLERAGAAPGDAADIAYKIERELYRGMTTQEIYRRAFAHLREARRSSAARYSLKRALLEFGPSGFPFERYLEELFRAEGYTAKVDQIIKGTCVEHEVDLVLEKNKNITYVEAKFHNSAGFKTDLKTVLYVRARLTDIGAGRGLVATNTKFTDKALQYAQCSLVDLLGWDTPVGSTLHDKIDRSGLYPVTALTTLNRREKVALLGQNIVLCRDLQGGPALASLGVSGRRVEEIAKEVGDLCATAKGIQ